MTDMNGLEDELKDEFEMFSVAIPRSDVMDKSKKIILNSPGDGGKAVIPEDDRTDDETAGALIRPTFKCLDACPC